MMLKLGKTRRLQYIAKGSVGCREAPSRIACHSRNEEVRDCGIQTALSQMPETDSVLLSD